MVQTYAWAGMLFSYAKEDGLLKGYVSATEVSAGGKKSLYVITISGNRINEADTKMILNGLLKGAKETFSGEKPCALCCKIADAKKSDSDGKSKELPLSPTVKLLKEMLPSSPLALSPPRFTEVPEVMFTGMNEPVETSACAPPVPPPRRVAR